MQWDHKISDLGEIKIFGRAYSTAEILITKAKKELSKHPHIEKQVCEMLIKAQYTNISHKKSCKASDCQERAGNVLDGTDSEWWTEAEVGWLEIDLGCSCEVHQVDIQWWGTSVSSSYTILAGDSQDSVQQVRCQEEEVESPEGYNGWSQLAGWKRKTRFVRINLEKGSLDPWGMNKYFGIRQVNITGKHC